MSQRIPISIRLNDKTIQQLNKMAELDGRTLAGLARKIIEDALKKKDTIKNG